MHDLSLRFLANPELAKRGAVPFVVASLLTGCGGAASLLEPAHPLPKGFVEYGAGVSTQIALGPTDREIAKAENIENPSGPVTKDWLRGAYRASVLAPGVAPWLGGRVGLGGGNEGSLIYTGRNLRVGARHAWLWDRYALSLGGGLSSVLTHSPAEAHENEGFSSGQVWWPASGVGLDVPLTLGYSSESDLVQAWVGARGGFEALFGDFPYTLRGESVGVDASAQHWQAGAFVGLAVGVSPVWVRAELAGAFHGVTARASLPADADERAARDHFSGFSLAPAGALVVQF